MKSKEIKTSKNVLSKILSVLGVFLVIVLLPIVIVNLILIVKGTINTKVPPSLFGITPLVVLSDSMDNDEYGSIKAGDLIFVKQTDVDSLKANDIIAFMEDRVAIAHRIARVETNDKGETTFVTKGDSPYIAEDKRPVQKENVLGVYFYRIAELGNVVVFMQKPLGIVCFIVIPCIIFILYDAKVRREYYEEKD